MSFYHWFGLYDMFNCSYQFDVTSIDDDSNNEKGV